MAILLENAHLHHTKVEAEGAVDGVITDNVEDVREDEEGTCISPRTNSCHVGPIGASKACT